MAFNIEEIFVITNREVCEQKRLQFEQLWQDKRSLEVDLLKCDEIAKKPTRYQARAEAKAGAKERAAAARSASSGSAAGIAPPQQS